ncbi:MAG: TolC family protein, partial [Mucilaginibacter sp.]
MFRVFPLTGCLFFIAFLSTAQNKTSTSAAPPMALPDTGKHNLLMPVADTAKNGAESLSLQQCIDYAMAHQPGLNISTINIDVAKATNAINLAGALPQVSASGDLIHYLEQSQNGGTAVNSGTTSTTSTTRQSIANTFIPGIAVSQTLFNPSLLYAYKSAPLYVKQAQQVTDSTKIFLLASVSKSFYNLLLTLEQINVFKEDTARLGKSLLDAYHQYKGGIVDETDYEEASIT